MTTRKKLWGLVVLGLVVVVAVLVGIKAGQIGAMISAGESFVPPPEAVASARAEEIDWERTRSAIGTVVAVRGVTLGAELPGLVREIGFESGGAVQQGAVLVKLDTSQEEAQLAAARADAALARLTLERARSLRAANSNARADLEQAEARAQSAAAAVAALQATIAKKTIRAPFDGRITIRQVELGQVVPSGAPVASLHSVSPMYVEFWLPQGALAELAPQQRVRIRTDTFPGASWEGVVEVVNPEVDPATRNVRVRAAFANPDGRLRPGMFANVEVIAPERRKAIVIPSTAVIYAPYGDSVFVIEEKEEKDRAGAAGLAVRQKFVRLGERRGDFVEVTSGLAAGERVVSGGAFKLRNGAAVVVNDALAPPAELAPRPAER